MTSNPYERKLNETFRGQHVDVSTGTGHTLRGYLGMRDYGENHAILHGATTQKSEQYLGTVVLYDVLNISLVDPPEEAREIDPMDVANSPYNVREYDDDDMNRYVRKMRRRGSLWTLPVVRPLEDNELLQFEIVSGHKRIEAAMRAGLDRVPVKVVPMSDWEALVWFADEHLPLDNNERNKEERGRGYYADDEAERSVRLMSEWSTEKLRTIPSIARVLDRMKGKSEPEPDVETAIEELESYPGRPKPVDNALRALKGEKNE